MSISKKNSKRSGKGSKAASVAEALETVEVSSGPEQAEVVSEVQAINEVMMSGNSVETVAGVDSGVDSVIENSSEDIMSDSEFVAANDSVEVAAAVEASVDAPPVAEFEASIVAEIAASVAGVVEHASEGAKRGKKPGDISARSVFAMLDAGIDMSLIRQAVESGDEAALEEMTRVATGKNKSATGKAGRPVTPEVQAVLAKQGITMDALYALSEPERKKRLASARAIAQALRDGFKLY